MGEPNWSGVVPASTAGRVRLAPDQNSNFKPNCHTRGVVDVDVILPKVVGVLMSVPYGGLNCEWFHMLKASARNCRVPPSHSLVFLRSAISQLNCPGPKTLPTIELP